MHLNLAWFRASDSAWFFNSHGTLTPWIVLTDLSKHVRTSCDFVNMARNSEIARRKLFFSVLTTSLSQFRADLNSSLVRSAGECWPYRKGVCSNPNWGLWVQKFSPIFVFLSIILATDMLENHSRALKMGFWPSFRKKTWARRMGQWVGAQSQVKVAKKMQKHPHLWRSPQRTPNQKQKKFFFDVN